MPISIAIDGPAGAGKSTIAKAVAKTLHFLYLDTGAMYRTCGLQALRHGLKPDDEDALVELIRNCTIEVAFVDGEQAMLLNGENVNSQIRTPAVSRWASDISRIAEVREMMVSLQRDIATKQNVVMDGRDIGTYVLPQADLKIYLTACLEERAKRRYLELQTKENGMDLEAVKEDIRFRDEQDSTRAHAPLKRAPDAILLDTSGLSIEEVIERVLAEVRTLTD